METELSSLRESTIAAVLARQDGSARWGFDERQAQERPHYRYYSPNFRSTLWTLVLLADLQAPPGLPQAQAALRLASEWFFDTGHGIFRLPGGSHFPIPCLNGNMIYLHAYFGADRPELLERPVSFFARCQRFDDGGFVTPPDFPYFSNRSCYGGHTCYWGVARLLKGLSFIPKERRSPAARELIDRCIEFILHHEVCFSSHRPERLLHPDIGRLAFPNFYKSDYLELLWLLRREGVDDGRMERALGLLQSRRLAGGSWAQDKHQNTIVALGAPGCPSPFITERATSVLG